MLADSGIAYALLRNGWYTETISPARRRRLSTACLSAQAGNAQKSPPRPAQTTPPPPLAIAEEGHAGKVYELAGDEAWTLNELAAELSKQSGKTWCIKPQRTSPPR